jgi:NAD(P)-dependent dehydrogenase (short-subunit alcohol dehydrogenase family)
MPFTEETVSVVIGGTSGIGRAVADILRRRPGSVVAVSRRNGFDMTDETATAQWFQNLGPVDHVVVTAGSSAPSGGVCAVDLSTARQAFDAKFWGSIVVARAAAQSLKPGGTITLTSGFLSRRVTAGTFVKTAMNAALEASAKLLAQELAPLRVNVVSPGLTRTEAYDGLEVSARQDMFIAGAGRLPAGRVAEPEDVAAAYILAIDVPSMTGAVLDVDGGALIA